MDKNSRMISKDAIFRENAIFALFFSSELFYLIELDIDINHDLLDM